MSLEQSINNLNDSIKELSELLIISHKQNGLIPNIPIKQEIERTAEELKAISDSKSNDDKAIVKVDGASLIDQVLELKTYAIGLVKAGKADSKDIKAVLTSAGVKQMADISSFKDFDKIKSGIESLIKEVGE
ncbi:hypothetical protein BJAS_P3487 [Bathymodiolus japonicus methanotrophic gill symbiont]|uniref:hypothetical protein n=1 Tax=Bathymodiolus japonicus methanotrophic gill symbiont TaxID=113269 RepID=UPI001B5E4864|nr:hypothetical protein [Bathymodiolus japonicus methanotrophic gill symbiont]GFO72950.1 hypothetical protein BJAS_P3487 [Bathymodiolus japonicus methanotrophic gill symbiont]